mgnify:CR=1 FL=1
MPRKCALTGKTVVFGNNVSHAHNKTRRKFLPNLQNISFMSDILNRTVQLRVTPSGLRTVEAKGGIDEYLLNVCKCKLNKKAKLLRKKIIRAKKLTDKGVNNG